MSKGFFSLTCLNWFALFILFILSLLHIRHNYCVLSSNFHNLSCIWYRLLDRRARPSIKSQPNLSWLLRTLHFQWINACAMKLILLLQSTPCGTGYHACPKPSSAAGSILCYEKQATKFITHSVSFSLSLFHKFLLLKNVLNILSLGWTKMPKATTYTTI